MSFLDGKSLVPHGGMGGVADYFVIALESQRPFYGIQAKGYQTDELPLVGIEAMSAYYVQIITSIQSEGPYDLGGYSLGGAISYEVARQLQELGQAVSTITMLDTPDFSSLNIINKIEQPASNKTGLMRAFNSVLTQGVMTDPKEMILIHRDELNMDLDGEAFLQQMITLARKKGCSSSEAELKKTVKQVNDVEAGYRQQIDPVRLLSHPGELICYYFRNKSSILLGDLAPYLSVDDREAALDYRNNWKDWESNIPNFYVMDVDSSSHMMILTENKVRDTIVEFCKKLYSNKGMNADQLKYFKNRTKRNHGVMDLKILKEDMGKNKGFDCKLNAVVDHDTIDL